MSKGRGIRGSIMMIVDWARNGAEVYQTKRLTLNDFSDNKTSLRQEIMYIKYLHEALHLDKENCRKEWEQLANGSAMKNWDDPEGQRLFFSFLWSRATSEQYNKFQCTSRLQPVIFYQEELDYLNSLEAPMWVKQYWCAMLIYYKFQKQNLPDEYPFVQRTWLVSLWALSLTSSKEKRYSNLQDVIAQWQMRQSLPVMQYDIRDTINLYRPAFICDDGTVVAQIDNIDEVQSVTNLILDQIHCINCGTWFTRNFHCRRKLCPKCYNEIRREYKTRKDRERRTRIKELADR